MMHTMINRILGRLGLPIRINLIGHRRDGGYTYITSPDLPGFTFLLEPGEEKSLSTLINALEEPLSVYLVAHFKARHKADGMKLAGLRRKASTNYVAELCPA